VPTGATSDAAAYRVADADLVAVLAADTAGDVDADTEDPPGSALRGAS
jgi:hypothetical protein